MELINNENVFSHHVTKKARLYDYLKDELKLSLRLTNELMKSGNLLINKQPIKKNIMIVQGDVITIYFTDEFHHYELENLPIEILYESVDLLIINKEPNILVHPTQNHLNHTITNAVAYYFDQIGLKRKIRFVNRLDRDTSGILIAAKNAYAHQFLAKQFDEDLIVKKYLTLIEGELPSQSGIIDASILRNDESKYEVDEEGKESKTLYNVIKEYEHYSLVECELKSGRTHQIRVHLASIGGFILGDHYYNKQSDLINRQALHAYELTFIEPRTHEKVTINSDLPIDMKKLL